MLLALRRLVSILTVILIAPLSFKVFLGNSFSCQRLCRASHVSSSCFSHIACAFFEPCSFLLLRFYLIFDIFQHKFPSRFLQLCLSCRTFPVASLWYLHLVLPCVLSGVSSSVCGLSHNLQWVCHSQLHPGACFVAVTASARFCVRSASPVSVSTSVVACHLKSCCWCKSSRRASSCSSRISFAVPGSFDVVARHCILLVPAQFACPSSCHGTCLRPPRRIHLHVGAHQFIIPSRLVETSALVIRHSRSVCNHGRSACRKRCKTTNCNSFLLGPDSVDMLCHASILCRFVMLCSCLPPRFCVESVLSLLVATGVLTSVFRSSFSAAGTVSCWLPAHGCDSLSARHENFRLGQTVAVAVAVVCSTSGGCAQ